MSFSSPYFTLPTFKYVRPSSVKEVIEILQKYGDDARLMAGGVGVINMLKERLMDPRVIVDLKGVPELHKVEFSDSKGLVVGATVTLRELLDFQPLRKKYPALWEAVSVLSDSNLRNRSTLVGDLCEATPWVDSPPPLVAYGATVNVAGPSGTRSVLVGSFIKGMAQLDLSNNEVVTSVSIPKTPRDSRGRYYKFSKGTEFGLVNLAVVASEYEKGIPSKVRVVYGGISDTPVEATGISDLFQRSRYSETRDTIQLIDASLSWVRNTVQAMDDNLATAEYRKHLLEVMTAQALKEMILS